MRLQLQLKENTPTEESSDLELDEMQLLISFYLDKAPLYTFLTKEEFSLTRAACNYCQGSCKMVQFYHCFTIFKDTNALLLELKCLYQIEETTRSRSLQGFRQGVSCIANYENVAFMHVPQMNASPPLFSARYGWGRWFWHRATKAPTQSWFCKIFTSIVLLQIKSLCQGHRPTKT